jgi:hypothetical protein
MVCTLYQTALGEKIDANLIRKNIESWCPLQKIERQWSDRKNCGRTIV